ncbi:cytochrome P450 [Rhypophila decipiens]|uniref:Cytochrome P450 n=1 Tax=Rhypophila decipiens TaxID=261697 RepID=A0AAN6Y091_9PEZI|nr:cytochrome P450 [Rhypophila decipiens]
MLGYVVNTLKAARFQYPVVFPLTVVATAICAFWLAILKYFEPAGKRRGRDGTRSRLPRGPRGCRSLACSRRSPTGTLNELAKYGEMTTMHLGSKTWILLNSHRVINEIIAKRGSLTNTRSPMPISSGLVSRDRRSIILPQEQWAERRRVMHGLLSGTALRQYGTWQEEESTKMMAEYVFQPQRWYRHHYRYANSVIVRITLGDRPFDMLDKDLEDMQNAVTFFLGSIGKGIVDWFPKLAKIPRVLQVWCPYWERLGQWNYELYSKWYNPVKAKVENGTAGPSFVRDYLMHPDTRFKGDSDDLMYVAMQLIEAGSDTTREALNIMTMAALEYPDIFAKARAEVDRVCGVGKDARLPTLEDMEVLPYISAMCKEVLRWRPIFPMLPEHVATQDIEFEGYYFPAGTGFVINGSAVGMECEDPERFLPERWLNGHEQDIAHGLWQFGGGRRICVAYRLAQRSLFINVARLAQCIDYKPNGPYSPDKLNLEAVDEPFSVQATLRSEDYKTLILEEARRIGVLEEVQAKFYQL